MGDKQLNIIIKAKDMASAALKAIGVAGKKANQEIKDSAVSANEAMKSAKTAFDQAAASVKSAQAVYQEASIKLSKASVAAKEAALGLKELSSSAKQTTALNQTKVATLEATLALQKMRLESLGANSGLNALKNSLSASIGAKEVELSSLKAAMNQSEAAVAKAAERFKVANQELKELKLSSAQAAIGLKEAKAGATLAANGLNTAKEAAKEADAALKNMEQNSSKTGGALASVRNIYLAIAAAIAGAAIAVKKFTDAWLEQEKTTTRLNAAIQRSGQSLNETSNAFSEYTGKMQAMGVAESTIEENLIKLTNAGLSAEQAMKLNSAAMALGYRQFGSFEAGTKAAEMALNGAAKGMKRLGVEVDATASKAEIAETIIRAAGDTTATFGDYANTAGGKLSSLKEFSGEVKEAIGKGLVGGLTNAISTTGSFNERIEKAIGWLDGVSKVLAVWVVPGIAAFLKVLWNAGKGALQPLINLTIGAVHSFKALSAAMRGDASTAAKESELAFKSLRNTLKDTIQDYKNVYKVSKEFVTGSASRNKLYDKMAKQTKEKTVLTDADTDTGGGGAEKTKAVKAGREKTKDELAEDRLRQTTAYIEKVKILNNLEDNSAEARQLELESLNKVLPVLEQMVGHTGAYLTALDRIQGIHREIGKEQEAAAKKQREDWDRAVENDTRESEKDLKEIADAEEKRKEELARLWNATPQVTSVKEDEAAAAKNRRDKTNQIKQTLDLRLKEIEAERQLATLTGETTDALSEEITALAQAIYDLQQNGADASQFVDQLKTKVAARSRQKQAEDYAKDAKEKADAQTEAMRQIQQQQYDEQKNLYKSAIIAGMTEGSESGAKALADAVKSKMIDSVAESLASSAMGGDGEGGFDLASLFGLGGGTGKQVPTAGGGFAQGWGAMASQVGGAATGGGKGGGLLSFLGLGGGAGGAGIMGTLGSIMPWFGAASLISGFTKHKSVAQSGTQAIFDTKPTVRGTDTGALMSSDIFQRAMFSSRNKGNALLASTMAGRTGERNISITVKTEKGFSAKVEADMAAIVKSNTMRGVHRRTNFEHQ